MSCKKSSGKLVEPEDNTILWAEESSGEEEEIESAGKEKWKIMIIDDDETVHSVTKLALQNFSFENRGLEFISGYSGFQAKALMKKHPDTAILLLDVVMENDDAGLAVVRCIRNELKNPFVRIILRTGQPGQAPEEQVVMKYDINDYKEKTELTARKLFTTVVAALRTYRDLITIDANREGLKKIIEASASMFKIQSLSKFVSGVLLQLISLLGLHKNSLYCNTSGLAATKNDGQFIILAATGDFEIYLQKNITTVLPSAIREELTQVMSSKQSMFFGNRYIGYHHSHADSENIIYLEGFEALDPLSQDLITVFFNNVSTAFDNLYLNNELANNQTELFFTLGEMAETRSRETGFHIKRVAQYCRLFAEKYGLSEEETNMLLLASSMHDIGKLAIEDHILKKPGRLTDEEYAKMKEHALAGYQILTSSSRPLLQTAALIALQHHEKYDGSGYPQGLRGDAIHIYGRITAIADVFDALSSDRVYRSAWDLEQVYDYIRSQSGKHFDPRLVAIFFQNREEFLTIRDHSPE
ncbi:MAG: DUF3369 domain-containing protein [Veillonellales bacterium]